MFPSTAAPSQLSGSVVSPSRTRTRSPSAAPSNTSAAIIGARSNEGDVAVAAEEISPDDCTSEGQHADTDNMSATAPTRGATTPITGTAPSSSISGPPCAVSLAPSSSGAAQCG